MSQREKRPHLNSATEHLLLNPTAIVGTGRDRDSGVEPSKLTKLRQDLHLKALEVRPSVCLSVRVLYC